MASVQDNGDASEPFLVCNDVKQGCVLAPTLFSLMFSVFSESDVAIDIRYRTQGKLFNFRRLLVRTKVTTDTIRDFLFPEDCALNTASETDMQYSVDKLSDACDNFGLTISTKKTEVMHQSAPGRSFIEPNITFKGQRVRAADRFTYLGSTLSRNATIDEEVNSRIAKASATFDQLHNNVWNRRGISPETKLKVYRATYAAVRLWDLDSLPAPCQETEPLPHNLPQEAPWDQMARQGP
ncbi:uncharacterized protein LOC143294201 [Babylonia areolata]|uniref:uncharacterized protein LOC143294201 n=1 Tax=Babylonia areolata TaxID=304850 RepID=UPI003FD66C9D